MNQATATTVVRAVRQHGGGLVHTQQPRAHARSRQLTPRGGVINRRCEATSIIHALFPSSAAAAYPLTGVRSDESINRRYLPECDEVGGGLFNYRPILKWYIPAVFEAHRYMGIKPNPLYSQGMGRVGCMPCINCRKHELREIANRFPEVVDRIDRWEQLVQQASKRGAATFFAGSNAKHPKGSIANMTALEVMEIASIRQAVEWSRTTRGGLQYDLLIEDEPSACTSAYGLCESTWEPVKLMEAA